MIMGETDLGESALLLNYLEINYAESGTRELEVGDLTDRIRTAKRGYELKYLSRIGIALTAGDSDLPVFNWDEIEDISAATDGVVEFPYDNRTEAHLIETLSLLVTAGQKRTEDLGREGFLVLNGASSAAGRMRLNAAVSARQRVNRSVSTRPHLRIVEDS
ncbi:MAG: hypothetical protein WDN66_05025, partial [Candidatus Saccharibacteria bacterium]